MEPYFKKDVIFNLKKYIKQKLNPGAHKFSVVSLIKLEIIKEKFVLEAAIFFSNKIPVLEPKLNCTSVQKCWNMGVCYLFPSQSKLCV